MKDTPWAVNIANHSVIESTKSGRFIATTCHKGEYITDEDTANARFIAKAPQMYEALKKIRRILNPGAHQGPGSAGQSGLLQINDLINSALED